MGLERGEQLASDALGGLAIVGVVDAVQTGLRQSAGTPGDEAKAYRFCLEIRQRSEIHQELAPGAAERVPAIDTALTRLVTCDLMFQEGAKFLALALAPDAAVAARRIRAAHHAPVPVPVRRLAVIR